MNDTRQRGDDRFPEGSIEVRFDEADHAWLVAYTYAISAVTEAILAFDPTPVFADLLDAEVTLSIIPSISNTFDIEEFLSQSKIAGIAKSKKEAWEVEARNIQKLLHGPEYEISSFRQKARLLDQQISSIKSKVPDNYDSLGAKMGALASRDNKLGDTRNMVYALFKIFQQPPNKFHLANVEQYLREMFSQNQLFWEKVMLETDNDREWLPNPSQVSAFGITIDAELADVWQLILEDALAVLDGRLLVPHRMLLSDVGINVTSWFDNPSSLSPIGWNHGRAAYPYLARGPKVTRDNWLIMQSLTQGNAFAFSIYLN